MTVARLLAFGAVLVGGLVLTLIAVGLVLVVYYRPTFESVIVAGRLRGAEWLTPERFAVGLVALVALIGGLLLWAGIRWLHA